MIVDYLHQPLPTIDTFFVLLIHQFLQMFLIKTILLWRLVSTHTITAMATSCFNSSPMATTCGEEDSIILFSASNSNSPDDDFSSASSSFSSSSISTSNLPYSLSLINLSYTINVSSSLFQTPNPVKILDSVSFTAQSSKIMAVIGPSGTGKSTLLKIISGRVNYKQLDPSSAILINGGRISDYDQLRRVCGFVPQDDDLLPLLTVKETLMYSAKFNLRDSMMMPKEREERVESLLRDLGLVLVKDSFVGEGDEEERGVSGGERKRVSIAVEMIRDPPILLLDEPTSGLDSRNSLQVIELLASMAKSKQRTVVLSIHQPSYRILDYISDYLLLSRGSVVHCGNLESLEESITKLGFQIPAQLNPIEFAMEIVDSLRNSNSNSGAIPIPIPQWIWPSSEEEIKDDRDRIKQKFHLLDIAEISFLCSRFCKIIYRTKQLFFARTMQAVVAGLGLGSVYTRVSRDEEGVAERLGLFAFSLSFLLSSTVEALPIYLHERRVLMKESSRGAYRISSYMIANTIAFLPFLFVVSILFSIPVYWIVGLNPSFQAFCFFILVVWLIILMASSLVLFLSAVSPDFISGNSLICTVLGAFFLFSGYFIPKENIPKPWMFMYYVSLYRYPLESMLVNEYWSLREECFSSGNNSSRCLMKGEDVLKQRGLDKDMRWMNVGIMLAFFVFYRLLCWGILIRKASKSTL